MSYLSAILLGLIQGVAEFLPISSSGHLAVFQNFFKLTNLEEGHLFFDVLLHLGTLIAVLIAYWQDIAGLIREFFVMCHLKRLPAGQKGDPLARRQIFMIIIGTLPLFLVLPIKSHVEALYYNTFFIGAAFLVTGTMLFFSDRISHGKKDEKEMTALDALFVGVSQAIAVVPGLSRSGTTISAGLLRGFSRTYAVKFSFLLSIPAVLGSNILSLIDAAKAGIDWSLLPAYLAGILSAMIFGYLSIRLLKYIAQKGKFGGFCYYCWGAGLVTLILSLFA